MITYGAISLHASSLQKLTTQNNVLSFTLTTCVQRRATSKATREKPF